MGPPPSVRSRGKRNEDKRSLVYNLLSGGNGSLLICDNGIFRLLYNEEVVVGLLFEAIPIESLIYNENRFHVLTTA